MKLFELYRLDLERDLSKSKLFEINAIDQELADTASAVSKSGENPEMDDEMGDDMGGMDGLDDMGDDPFADGDMEGDMGDMGDMEGEEEAEPLQDKEIETSTVAAVTGMNYLKNYQHDEDSKIYPMRILQMEMDELLELRRLVKVKITNDTIMDTPSPEGTSMAFYQDLLSFVDRAIDGAKTEAKDADEKQAEEVANDDTKSPEQKKAKAKEMESPKNDKAAEFKHNANKKHKD